MKYKIYFSQKFLTNSINYRQGMLNNTSYLMSPFHCYFQTGLRALLLVQTKVSNQREPFKENYVESAACT